MFCTHCGSKNENDGLFCTNCGAPLSSQNAAPAEQPAQPVQPVQPPYYNYNQPQTPVADPAKGMSTASMICGILSLLCVSSIITGSLGIIFGAIAKSKGSKSGMSTAGIICGAIGVALFILFIVVSVTIGMTEDFYSYSYSF